METGVRITGSNTSASPRATVWYRHPGGSAHAFVGFRSVCDRFTWQASWGIVGPIEAVDRAEACSVCITLTGSTEAELRAQDGGR